MARKKELSNDLKFLTLKRLKAEFLKERLLKPLDVLKTLFAKFGRKIAQKMMQEICFEAVVHEQHQVDKARNWLILPNLSDGVRPNNLMPGGQSME